MNTRKLTEKEFQATINKPTKAEEGAEPLFDFWDYVEKIPAEDFEEFDCTEGNVNHVYQMQGGKYEHVIINSTIQGVGMVIVNDLKSKSVYGHNLLDLNKKTGEIDK